jgi:ribosomal protein S18 acetylase RimI-like enzyme
VDVRIATVDDAPAIETIRIRGWQRAYRHVFPPERLDAMPIDWSRWEARIADPPAKWTILVTGYPVVGFAATGPSRDDDGLDGVGELYGIYVDPEAWGTGAGRALIGAAEDALARDFAEATLWVLEDNPRARRFYELAGWRWDGTRKSDTFLDVDVAEVRYRRRLVDSRPDFGTDA